MTYRSVVAMTALFLGVALVPCVAVMVLFAWIEWVGVVAMVALLVLGVPAAVVALDRYENHHA